MLLSELGWATKEPDPAYWHHVPDNKPLYWERNGIQYTARPRVPGHLDRVTAVTDHGLQLAWPAEFVYRSEDGDIAFAYIGVSGIATLLMGPAEEAPLSYVQIIERMAS